jgi:DNA-binding MarR family transcriptional regulator
MSAASERPPVRDRVLQVLKEHPIVEDRPAPEECTQKGLVASVGSTRTYVEQQLTVLELEGLIERRTCRIRGGTRRKAAYCLTDKGKRAASFLV